MSFCQRVVATAEARAGRVAMTLLGPQGNSEVTFGEMLRQVRSVAWRLAQAGLVLGDRVALIGENHPRWAVAYLGAFYQGLVVVPLDPAAPVETLAAFMADAGVKLAFAAPSAWDKVQAIATRNGPRVPLVALHDAPETVAAESFTDWLATPTPQAFDAAPLPAQDHDAALLMYTSGTTGQPKAVQLTHGNIAAQAAGVQEVMHLSEREIILSVLPLFHAYAQIVNLWLATTIGLKVVYLNEINPAEMARGLREGKITTLTGVPRLWYLFHKKIFDAVRDQPAPLRALFRVMLRLNGGLRDWLGLNAGRLFFRRVHEGLGGHLRLAISAGSSFDAQVARDFHSLGFTILQAYGLTETAGAATVTRFEDNKVGSVGTPLNAVEVKIDEPNAAGIGEVLIRGPIVMPGYYRNAEANRAAFTDDKWFRSGDLGRFDKDGHLYIVGRKKDVIVLPSGKNIYPEDVEAHYARSPLVGEVCVLGVKDTNGGFAQAEKLCAVVVPDFAYLKKERIANAYEALRFALDGLGRELPEAQRVRDYVMRVEPLPRTAIRKIRRFELKAQIEAAGTTTRQTRDAHALEFTTADRELLQTVAAQQLSRAVKIHAPDAGEIHPSLNLELDLGLDSLARAECVAQLEQALGVTLPPEDVATAHTFGELVELAQRLAPVNSERNALSGAKQFDWQAILAQASPDAPELQAVLRPKPLTTALAYLWSRSVFLAARIFLQLDVQGREVLDDLPPPYLVCPNHQSYLDAVLVCATYPRHILREVFHVGASEYFRHPVTRQLARWLNIVPVDPDANLLRAMRAGAAGLRAGKILNIYPEGERSFDGALHPYKKGAAILAAELDLPVVPVALDGVYRVWPRGAKRLRLAKVTIRFGTPLNLRAIAALETDREKGYAVATDTLKGSIQKMLDEIRQ